MRKETDLAKIKAVAHTFLVMDIQPTAHAPVVVSHPFTNSGFVGSWFPCSGPFPLGISWMRENCGSIRNWRIP